MKRVVTLFCFLGIFSIFFSCKQNTIPNIGFYGVNTQTRESFSDSFKRFFGDTPYSVITLDDSLPLSEALKKQKQVSLVISWFGPDSDDLSKKLITPDPALYNRYPTTVRNLSSTWVPLLGDHSEIAYRLRNLRNRKEGMPRTLEEVTAYAGSIQGKENVARWPIVLPGQDDRALSLFMTSLVEATWDAETAKNLNRLITETEQKALAASRKVKGLEVISVYDEVKDVPLNTDGATLQAVIDMLNQWRAEDLLHPEWETRKPNYVEILMEDGQAEIVFMPLSIHRTMNFRVVQNFTESFMPVNRQNGADFSRSLVIPALCAAGIHQKAKGADAETLRLLDFLTGNDELSEISIVSGLAPLTSAAEAADSQANNVRFWAAASDELVQDMGSAFTSKGERTAFFEAVRASIQ